MGGLSVFTCIRNSGNSPNKTDHRSMPQSLPTTALAPASVTPPACGTFKTYLLYEYLRKSASRLNASHSSTQASICM